MKLTILLLCIVVVSLDQFANALTDQTTLNSQREVKVQFSASQTTLQIYRPIQIECSFSGYDFESITPRWFLQTNFFYVTKQNETIFIGRYMVDK